MIYRIKLIFAFEAYIHGIFHYSFFWDNIYRCIEVYKKEIFIPSWHIFSSVLE